MEEWTSTHKGIMRKIISEVSEQYILYIYDQFISNQFLRNYIEQNVYCTNTKR